MRWSFAMYRVNLMPDWAQWFWVGIFLSIGVTHLAHLVRMHGLRRIWHLGHVLMGVGMAYMFVPLQYRDTSPRHWQVVFAAATVLAFGYALLKARKGTQIDIPWITLTVDLGAMIYMWAMMSGIAWPTISYAAAGPGSSLIPRHGTVSRPFR